MSCTNRSARPAALRPAPSIAALALALAACSPGGGGPGILDQVFEPDDPARFAYAVNLGDSTLSTYVVDPGTGRLTHQGYFAFPSVEVLPEAAAVSPDREHLYVVGAATQAVSVLRADRATGALTNVSTQPGAGVGPYDLVVHPTQDWVYVSAAGSDQVAGFRFDRETGFLSPLDGSPRTTAAGAPSRLLMDPRGRFLVAVHFTTGAIQTWELDQGNGRLFDTTQTLSLAPSEIGGAVIDRAGGNLYVSLSSFDTVSRIEIGDGYQPIVREARAVEFDPLDESFPMDVALHPTGNYLYVLNQGTQRIFYFTVDRSDLTLVQQGFLGPTAGAQRIFFEPVGETAYLVDDAEGSLARYAWDFTTGALSFREETRARVTPLDLVFVQDEDEPNLRVDKLYVTSRGSSDVTTFAANTTTGALQQIGAVVPAGTAPLDLALARPGPYAFAVSSTSADLSRFRVLGDGSLERLDPPVLLTGLPSAVAADPSGRFVYAASSGTEVVQAFAILAEGELVPVGEPLPVGDDPAAARVDPTGRFLYVANGGQMGGGPGGTITIFAIEPRNGALTQVIPGGTAPGGPLSLGFSPTGARVYVPVVQLDTVLPYDVAADLGTLSLIGSGTPAPSDPVDVVISPTGRFAYVALRNANDPGAVLLFDVRVSDGALFNAEDESLTPRQVLAVGPDPVALAIEPRENFLYVADGTSDEVWRMAIADDGTLTALGTNPAGLLPVDLELTTRVE